LSLSLYRFLKELRAALPKDFKAKGEFIVFIDECHRTKSGLLHGAMKEILPNAIFIGFTGTPLLVKDKKTSIEVFSPGYIHTYKYDEAVADGVVLNLRYIWGKQYCLRTKYGNRNSLEVSNDKAILTVHKESMVLQRVILFINEQIYAHETLNRRGMDDKPIVMSQWGPLMAVRLKMGAMGGMPAFLARFIEAAASGLGRSMRPMKS